MNDYSAAQKVIQDLQEFNSMNQGDDDELTEKQAQTIRQMKEKLEERIKQEQEDEVKRSKDMLGIAQD